MQNSKHKEKKELKLKSNKFTSRIAGYKAVVHNSIIVGKNC
jgi:hypothetical protein